jgi:hypothetical protein
MRRSGIGRLALSAGIIIAAFFVVAVLSRPSNTAGPCTVIDRALLPDVPEASGLAASRRYSQLLWTHNDSGNDAVLFAIDTSGVARGRVRVPSRLRDWEDISAAPCISGDCLYIGDIGDNSLARRNIQILVIPEPDPTDAQTARPDTYTVTYADGPHNAEAMFIVGGRLFIVTRDRVGGLYASATPLGGNHTVMLQRLSELGLVEVTDAEASPDAAAVAVRTSEEVVLYQTADLVRGEITPRARIPIDGLREPQGEAVAPGENGMLYLAGEGRPWNRAGRFISLRCNPGPT